MKEEILLNIQNRVGFVTGGASGLGEATARKLISEGAKVIIADLQEEKGQALAEELGDDALFVKTDVTDETSVKQAVKTAAEKWAVCILWSTVQE